MSIVQENYGELGGETLDPILGDSITGINTSTFTYISVPQKPKYVNLISRFNNSSVIVEWANNVQYSTFYYNGTYYDRNTEGAIDIDVQDDKVGFKLGASQWSNIHYTICF